jgi:hypothetical protein
MPSLAEITAAAQLDPSGLAAIAGVDPQTASQWLDAGEVPEEHRGPIADALGVDPDELAGTRKRKPGRKPKRRRTGLTAEADHVLRTAVTLTYASEQHRLAATRLAKVDPDPAGDPAETLYDTVAKLGELSQTTRGAVRAINDLWSMSNPIKVGVTLGGMDRRQLGELMRISAILLGKPDEELPVGDDAYLTVAERVTESQAGRETLEWLLDLAS